MFGKLKQVGASFLKKMYKPVLVGCTTTIVGSGATYYITVNDGSYKAGDNSNTPYAVEQYTNNVTIDSDGNITTDMTVQELWDKMLEDGSRVDQYLDSPEELKKLITAQSVTNYLDTRSNPNAEINWENINNDLDSKDVQGIIKLKRAKNDGTISTLTYKDPETFQSYIDKYNETGSETDKNKALSHFTLEKGTSYVTLGPLQVIDGVQMNILTDNGKVTFYNGDGSAMEGGSNDRFGEPLTDGKVAARGLAPDHSVIYIQTQESGEGSFANGKFFYICDTGGGLESNQIDVYANVSQAEMNATPYGTYNGAKISLVEENVTWEDYLSKYYNKTLDDSSGDTGAGSSEEQNNSSNLSTTTRLYAKVATWTETTEIITSNNPEAKTTDADGDTTVNMTTTPIYYDQFVSGYEMPFDYLWALLVVSQDKDFVFELVDLVYDSEIEITVHDNLTTDTKIKTDTYTNKTKVVTDNIKVGVKYGYYEESDIIESVAKQETPEIKYDYATEEGKRKVEEINEDYETKYTTITKTNTLNVGLTKADVWIVKYSQVFKKQKQDDVETTSPPQEYGEEYPEKPNETHYDKYTLDSATNFVSEFEEEVREDYSKLYNTVAIISKSFKTEYYYRTVGTINIYTKLESTQYISETPDLVEKVEKDDPEPNFVNILAKNRSARNNIVSASSWLFEILENGPKTADMLDLTKYLLYKVTGNVYDNIKEFDFSIYDPANFKTLNGIRYTFTGSDTFLWKNNYSKEDFVKYIQNFQVPNASGSASGSSHTNQEGWDTFFKNNAGEWFDICTSNGVDPIVLMSIGLHESGYGTSNIAWEKANLWGWSAYDSSPMESAASYMNGSTALSDAAMTLLEDISKSLKETAQNPDTSDRYNIAVNNGAISPDLSTIGGTAYWYCSNPESWTSSVTSMMKTVFGDFINEYCSGISLDGISPDVQAVLAEVMATWPANMESGRSLVIQKAASLINKGCHYSQDLRDPASECPQYLDCSSYVTWAFRKSGYVEIPEYAYTGTYATADYFSEISESQLIPGDIGLNNKGTAGGNTNHVGIYIGKNAKGQNIWLHCTSSGINGPQVRTGNGNFKVFFRYDNW